MNNPNADTPSCLDLMTPVTEADHRRGDLAAPVVLVGYTDYECPHCLNAEPVVAELQRRLGDQLCVVYRHFPLNSIHPHASAAAQAAEAAALQGRFWEMHQSLLRHQHDLGDIDLSHLALQLGLEVYRFQGDSERPTVLRKIREDYQGGLLSGVNGTPTFFINGCRYGGEVSVEAFLSFMPPSASQRSASSSENITSQTPSKKCQ